jgi:hypothetical protein
VRRDQYGAEILETVNGGHETKIDDERITTDDGYLHKANIRDTAHSCHVELPVLFAESHDLLEDRSVASIGNQTLHVLQLVIFVPHLA